MGNEVNKCVWAPVTNIHELSMITGDVCKSEYDIDDDFDIEDIDVD